VPPGAARTSLATPPFPIPLSSLLFLSPFPSLRLTQIQLRSRDSAVSSPALSFGRWWAILKCISSWKIHLASGDDCHSLTKFSPRQFGRVRRWRTQQTSKLVGSGQHGASSCQWIDAAYAGAQQQTRRPPPLLPIDGTDGRTPDRDIDLAPHTMRVVPTSLQI